MDASKKIRFIFFLVIFLLQSCISVNGVVTGAQMTYNRHNLTNTLHDQYLTMKADRAIHWTNDDYKDCKISVSTFNNVIIITGEVPNQKLHDNLYKIVKGIPGVDQVYNLTTINNSASTLTSLSDTWITTKIKAQFIAENEIDPSQIKVITENGTVYLMGIVFPEQGDIAVDLARSTAGVQQVIRIFSYLHISKKHDVKILEA